MRDPQFLQNAMNMMKNPAARKEMMRNQGAYRVFIPISSSFSRAFFFTDRQLSNIEALPGGFNYLSSVFKDMQDPLGDSGEDPSTDEANKRLANAFGVKKASSPVESGPNSEPLPNPWAPPPQSSSRPLGILILGISWKITHPWATDSNNMMNRLGLFGSNSPFMSSAFSPASSSNSSSMPPQNNIMQSRAGGPPQGDLMEQMQWMQSLLAGPQGQSSTSPFIGSGFPLAVPSTSTPAAPPIDPEVTFTSQLTQLQEMGFSDRDKNKRALLAAGGNVQAAISYMLDRLWPKKSFAFSLTYTLMKQ